jgi:hypothetical protein
MLRALKKFARMIPVVRPSWLLREGEWEMRRGNLRRARRLLARGLEEATRLEMPRERELLRIALARVSK